MLTVSITAFATSSHSFPTMLPCPSTPRSLLRTASTVLLPLPPPVIAPAAARARFRLRRTTNDTIGTTTKSTTYSSSRDLGMPCNTPLNDARMSASVDGPLPLALSALGGPNDVRRTTDLDPGLAGVAEREREAATPCPFACVRGPPERSRVLPAAAVRSRERSALCGVTVREVAVLAMLDVEAECGGWE